MPCSFFFFFRYSKLYHYAWRTKNLYGGNSKSNGVGVVRMHVTTWATNKLQMNPVHLRVSRKLRPRKFRPQTLKTQTPWVSRKLRLWTSDPLGVSKTQNLPKNSDPLCISETQTLKPHSGCLENLDPKQFLAACQRMPLAVSFSVRGYLNLLGNKTAHGKRILLWWQKETTNQNKTKQNKTKKRKQKKTRKEN